MIEKLTPEQEAALKPYAQSWIDRLDKGAPVDKPEAVRLIKKLYKFCNLKEPNVLIVNSPLGCQFAAMLLKHGGNVCDNICANVGNNVWRNVGTNVGANVRENVGNNAWNNVWNNVGNNIWNNVGINVGNNVRANVSANVRENVGAFENFCVYGSFVQDAGWCAYSSFFEDYCGLELPIPGWADFRDLIKTNLCECIQFDGLAIGCEMPMYVKRDEEGRLHNTSGLAIEWADGYGLHSLWGVRFERDFFQKLSARTVAPKEVLALDNIEQRMAALRLLGSEFICDAIDSIQVDKSERGNRLYSTNKLGTGVTEYFLRYSCPSTKREYVSFVPPEIGGKHDADLAMAWKFGVDKSVYQKLIYES